MGHLREEQRSWAEALVSGVAPSLVGTGLLKWSTWVSGASSKRQHRVVVEHMGPELCDFGPLT